MSKILKKYLTLIVLALILFNVVYLIVPFSSRYDSNYWIIFVFANIAILTLIPVFLISFSKAETLKSKVYGYPIYKVGITATIVAVIVSFIIVIVDGIIPVDSWITIVVFVVIYVAGGSGLLVSTSGRTIVEKIEKDTKESTLFINELQIKVSSLTYSIADKDLKASFTKLLDTVKYSDPVSNNKTKETEDKITKLVNDIENLVNSDNLTDIETKIDSLSNLLKQRNDLCKTGK
jgi:hypothetical protein